VSLHPEVDFSPANVFDVPPLALAYAREFAEAIGNVRGWEFTVKIPTSVWMTSAEKLIDRDDTRPFRPPLR